MKTQDSVDIATEQKEATHVKKRTRFATIGAILVVALIIGASAVVFAQLSQQHKNAAPPPAGQWVAVLQGYTITSLESASNAPGVFYACATRANTNFTVLRSADFGSHWQDIGSKAALGESCQLAINPTNSNDIFATSVSMSQGQATVMLKHSSDGGQSWTSVQPALKMNSASTPVAWNVQELRFVGTTLFGLQSLPLNMSPIRSQGVLPKYFTRLARLVSSTDGGQTWTVVDAQFTAGGQSVSSYAVDPTNSSIIYELVSTPWWPIQPREVEPKVIVPTFGSTSSLYKTSDGGATWHLLLNNLPFGTQLQLAGGNTQTLYVGGTRSPLPYIRSGATNNTNNVQSGFNLQMSSNGGATWRVVPPLPQASLVQSWFVDKNGQVFINTNTGFAPGEQPTAIVGTAIATTPITIPGMTPQTGTMPSISEHVVALTPPVPTSTMQTSAAIQHYDPSNNSWSAVTKLPAYGVLLAVTPGGSNSDVLWFLGSTNGQSTLYRFIA